MSARRILVGLIGANITKSLSPALHADAFAAAGMDGYYHLMDVDILRGRSLAQLLAAAKATGFAGTNVTFPFKQEVLALLDDLDHEAEHQAADEARDDESGRGPCQPRRQSPRHTVDVRRRGEPVKPGPGHRFSLPYSRLMRTAAAAASGASVRPSTASAPRSCSGTP